MNGISETCLSLLCDDVLEYRAQPIFIARCYRFSAGHVRHISSHPDGKSHSQPKRPARRRYAMAHVFVRVDFGIVAAVSLKTLGRYAGCNDNFVLVSVHAAWPCRRIW